MLFPVDSCVISIFENTRRLIRKCSATKQVGRGSQSGFQALLLDAWGNECVVFILLCTQRIGNVYYNWNDQEIDWLWIDGWIICNYLGNRSIVWTHSFLFKLAKQHPKCDHVLHVIFIYFLTFQKGKIINWQWKIIVQFSSYLCIYIHDLLFGIAMNIMINCYAMTCANCEIALTLTFSSERL